MQHLIVVRPFGPWRIGEMITDQQAIEAILASDHSTHVVRINPSQEI